MSLEVYCVLGSSSPADFSEATVCLHLWTLVLRELGKVCLLNFLLKGIALYWHSLSHCHGAFTATQSPCALLSQQLSLWKGKYLGEGSLALGFTNPCHHGTCSQEKEDPFNSLHSSSDEPLTDSASLDNSRVLVWTVSHQRPLFLLQIHLPYGYPATRTPFLPELIGVSTWMVCRCQFGEKSKGHAVRPQSLGNTLGGKARLLWQPSY